MQVTNLKSLSDSVSEKYSNFIVNEVNDHCLRLAVFEGDYRWHYHPKSDELFIVLEGELIIEFQEEETVRLGPNDTFMVPAGKTHRTRAEKRTVNLCLEDTKAETVFVD
jgi:mannose-6-phosphate isomerase-like protein (cupin superfamily)